jgi:transcription termination factor NusB
MSLYETSKEEQLRLLNEWLAANQKDIDEYQALVDEQMEKKRVIEEKVAKKLRPILEKVAVFQKFVNSFTNKKHKIEEEIEKLSEK